MKKLVWAVGVVCFLIGQTVAVADWDEGDPYKMHYPQLPKLGGYDVEFGGGGPGFGWSLGDDWQCTQTGPVSDIHFWVSWMQNFVQPIDHFTVTIYSDSPDPDGQGPFYSQPLEPLWTKNFTSTEYTIRNMVDDLQGWYDPSEPAWGAQDHVKWQQINIPYIENPYIQQEGTIYWLVIYMDGLNYVGWKESGSPHFMDDAVWWDKMDGRWEELVSPSGQSLDLAFVITPEPLTLCFLGLGGLALIRRR